MNRAIRHEELLEQMPWVQNLARRLVADPNDADDVAQSVWLTALERPPHSATSGRSLKGWLSAVIRTMARDQRRSKERRTVREASAARSEPEPSTAEVVERSLLQQELVENVHALDEPYRSTILYRYLDNLSATEIAEKTSVTPMCVRKRLSRGTAMLRERLKLEDGTRRRSFAVAILGPAAFESSATAATVTTVTSTGAASAAATKGAIMLGLKAKVAAVGLTTMTGVLVVVQAQDDEPVEKKPLQTARVVQTVPDAPVAEEPAPVVLDEPDLDPGFGPGRSAVARDRAEPASLDAVRRGDLEDELIEARTAAELTEMQLLFDQLMSSGEEPHCVRSGADENEKLDPRQCVLCHAPSSTSLERGPADRFDSIYGEDGVNVAQGPIRDHRKMGLWSEWYADGKKAVEGRYFDDELHGPWTTWHENGKQSSTGEYLYGKPEGAWTRWYPDGAQHQALEYRNGKRHGLFREWFEDGQLKIECSFYCASEDGAYKSHHANGQIESRGEFRYGNRVGPWLFWREDGTLDEEKSGTYADGKKVGGG